MERRSIKPLGLMLLTVVAVMAVNAAAAQANYDLLRNGTSVNSLSLVGTGLLGKLLTEGEINIHCNGATFSGTAAKNGGGASIKVSIEVLFEGCSVEGNPFCIIGSEQDALDGHKFASFLGAVAGHNGGSYFGLAEGDPFARVHFNGPFCTLPEEEEVTGSMFVTVLDAETNTTEKSVHMVDYGLFIGEQEATLEVDLAHVEEETGASFSIRLVGL